MLLGSKVDLEERREVATEEGQKVHVWQHLSHQILVLDTCMHHIDQSKILG